MIAYGVCVGSWEKLRRNVLPQVQDRALIALSGQTSIAAAYNTILDAYAERDVDAVVLLHDDLEITDPDAEEKFLTAIASGAGLAGVAGGGARAGLAWWNAEPVGHQRTDVMNIDFGTHTGEVELLEGSVLVFSPDAVKTLRFDTRFPGFHGYDEVAMAARAQMLTVAVVDVDTHHHTSMGYKSADSHAQWVAADRLFREKWGIR